MLDTAIDISTIIAAFGATLAFLSYAFNAEWWHTKSGTSVFVLFTSLMVLALHFALELFFGQVQVFELVAIWLVALASFNCSVTIAWKQWIYPRRKRRRDNKED